MRLSLLDKDLQETDLLPCYFFYGEETYLAHEFFDDLRRWLIPPDAPQLSVERLHFEDTSWREVIDLARTAPFLLSPWRLISLEMPPQGKKEKDREDGDGDEGPGKKKEFFSEGNERLVRDYLAAPASRSVLVITVPGKPNLSRRFMKFFTSFPPKVVLTKELKRFKPRDLGSWAARKLKAWKKEIDPDALAGLTDLVGTELERLDKELDKLATYVGEKKTIDEDDVRAVSAWTRDSELWELQNAFEARDAGRCLEVLAVLFQGGSVPIQVLAVLAGYFRSILAAQEGLRAGRDRKDIFKETHPQIRESFGSWYYDRLNEFFSAAQGLSRSELDDCLQRLKEIDSRLKSSGASGRTEIEAFVLDYCRRCRQEKPTWRARR
ncbi:MAG: DNA polymerase III subunit delta [Candidatus Aminicenantes bacterium RBG_13_63_10]|nr:MAG: DNA polymerase III subunit delta [Candidatus Aminicenantes bacterium RBG_13_63_10]